MSKNFDDDMFEKLLKETNDALNSRDGSGICKMINAMKKYGFNVQHGTNEDGSNFAYIDGDDL